MEVAYLRWFNPSFVDLKFLDKYKDYSLWLGMTINSHNGFPMEGRAASSTYFVVDEKDKIVGMCNIRHYLTEYLDTSGSGHIGYGVRPSERKKWPN